MEGSRHASKRHQMLRCYVCCVGCAGCCTSKAGETNRQAHFQQSPIDRGVIDMLNLVCREAHERNLRLRPEYLQTKENMSGQRHRDTSTNPTDPRCNAYHVGGEPISSIRVDSAIFSITHPLVAAPHTYKFSTLLWSQDQLWWM